MEESWALESGDSHGRLPFRASGRRDVDLGQNHSTETQPSPHTQPTDISLRMHVEAAFRTCSGEIAPHFDWFGSRNRDVS